MFQCGGKDVQNVLILEKILMSKYWAPLRVMHAFSLYKYDEEVVSFWQQIYVSISNKKKNL